MKLLLRLSFTAPLNTFLPNRVSPPNVIIRGFAAAENLQPELKVGDSFGLLKARTDEKVVESNSVSGRRMREAEQVVDETTTYNALVPAYCRDGRVVEALEILRCMIERGFEPNLVSFNAVIQGLCEELRSEEAEEVVEEMNRKGLALDQRTYTSLIRMFCRQQEVDEAHKVLSEMIDTGFSPSVAIYNELIHGYCCAERVEEAVGILRGMPDRGLSPDVVSYNTLIYKFCRLDDDDQLCRLDEPPELEKALEMKAEMLHKGILPDADTYSWLILPLCMERRLLEAFDLFREMLRGGLSTDEHTYTSLMDACCLEGEFSKAFHLHDAMIHKGFLSDFVTEFSPSLVTYNALIYGYCFLGRFEEALGILRGMAEMGLFPDTVSYSTVISGFCQIGEPGKAYELMVEMNEKGVRWGIDEVVYKSLMKGLSDEVTYTSLINAYCAEGEVYKAITLNDEMKDNGSFRRSVLSSVLINGLDKKARTREAKEILLQMVYNWGVHLPAFTYDTLIENCGNNEFKSVVELVKGLWMRGLENEAASVWNTVLQWNHKPDGAVYNLLIVEHCRCGNADKAYNMYMEMVHYGFASHMFSVLALIKALSYGRRYNEIRRVIQNALRSCDLNDSELHKALNEIGANEVKITDALLNVLAEIAMDGLLLNGGKCSYAPASA